MARRPVVLKRFASNAGANIFSGAVAAAYQLTITGAGSRAWHGAEFLSWALAFSVAAIAPVFAANLSSVITRRVVEARHGLAGAAEIAIVEAGRRIGQHLTLLALVVLVCAGAWIHKRAAPGALPTSSFLMLLVLMLSTNSWLLLWQVRFGQHFADERNWPPALTLAAARIGGAMGMIAGLAASSQSLGAAGLGLCAGTWTGLAFAQLLLPRPQKIRIEGSYLGALDIQKQYKTNLRLLSGFAVGAASMLVIQYSIPPLMALIAPERFNAFYLASTLNTVAVGGLAAAMSALLAPFARWQVSGDAKSLRRVALFSPILCVSCCLAVLCLCWYTLDPVLHALKLRAANIEDIRAFLGILGIQTIVRNAAGGYAMYIAAVGSPRQMATPLIIEIILGLTLAFPLGWFYGESALLYGLIISSLIGSAYSSRVVASISGSHRIRLSAALPSILTAQAAASVVWLLIIKSSI
jgi:hypothetical protein